MKPALLAIGIVLAIGLGIFGWRTLQPLTPTSMRSVIRAKSEVYQSIRAAHQRSGTWPSSLNDSAMDSADRERVLDAHGSFAFLSQDGNVVWYQISVPGWSG